MNVAALQLGTRRPPSSTTPATRSIVAIGTTATVLVVDGDLAEQALSLLVEDLDALDVACSRFRDDAELRHVERSSRGEPVAVSALLFDALEVACAVAVRTAGVVDPTVGAALVGLGYDRDFAELGSEVRRGQGPARSAPAPGWWQLRLDPTDRTVVVPSGVHVDLGATAKAFAADRAASRIFGELGCGVLVNLGGDVSVAGPAPDGGWGVGIAASCTTALSAVDEVVPLRWGGLASSGTTARSWECDGRRVHHIVDPWTGEAAPPHWHLVSVLAPSCVEANAMSTAAVVWGADAIGNLETFGTPARLVAADGSVATVGDWPGTSVGAA